MQLSSRHTVHYLEKALYSAGHIYGESWHHPVTRQKYISRFIYIIHKCHMVKRQWWKTSAFGVAAGHKDLHSHVESATFTNRIIRFPRGTGTIIVYCLPHLFPLNAGISLLLFHLRGKKEKAWDKERAYTGQRSSLQLTGGESYQKEQSSHFLDLFKPPNYRGLRSIAVAVSALAPAVHQRL